MIDKEITETFGPDEEGSVNALAPHDYKKGVADFMHYYKKMHGMCTQPFEGIVPLLQMLQQKGIRIAIATDKGKEASDLTLGILKLKLYFEKIENGSPKGSRKVQAIHAILANFGNVQAENV